MNRKSGNTDRNSIFNATKTRWITNYNFVVPVFFCILALVPALQGNIFAENVLSTVIITNFPEITSITASDPTNNAGYTNGDTITIRFSDSTNTPPASSKSQIDTIFSFSQSLGTNYSGVFTNPSTLVITVLNNTGNGNPIIGTFTMTVKASGNLKNSAGTSLASTSQSPTLTGSFGTSAGPYIIDFVVYDPGNASSQYSNGDTLTIRFSEPTNAPGGTGIQSKTAVNSLFSFSDVLGNNYSGQWINSLTFKITVIDVASGDPRIGTTVVQPSGTTPIRNSAQTSSPSTGTSSVLSGSFGVFMITQTVEPGESAISTLPSGIMSEIELPSDSAGEITIEKVEVTNNVVPTGTIDFIGDVIDVSLGNGASCTSGCIISFTFTTNDLPSGSTSSVKIFHDTNSDEDFGDAGEQLSTTITESTPGRFTASAMITSNSNIGIGIVTPSPTPPPTPSSPAPSSGGGSSGGGGRVGSSTSAKTASKSLDSNTEGFGGKILSSGTGKESTPGYITTQPNMPARIKNVAEWWSTGRISEEYFVQSINFLVTEKIIRLDETKNWNQPQNTPSWIKNVAEWWSVGKISDLEFVRCMQWLVNNGIIPYEQNV